MLAQSLSHQGGPGAKPKSAAADLPKLVTNTDRSLNSRKPLFVGKNAASHKSMNMINNNGLNNLVSAANPFKSIYYVDIISPSCDVQNMVEFVSNLGVRVLSCF